MLEFGLILSLLPPDACCAGIGRQRVSVPRFVKGWPSLDYSSAIPPPLREASYIPQPLFPFGEKGSRSKSLSLGGQRAVGKISGPRFRPNSSSNKVGAKVGTKLWAVDKLVTAQWLDAILTDADQDFADEMVTLGDLMPLCLGAPVCYLLRIFHH